MVGTRNQKIRVVLQDRDREILRILGILRVATRQQLQGLSGFNSRSRSSARLSALVDAGYLHRDFIGTIKGGRLAVYMQPTNRIRPRNGPAGLEAALNHHLAVADVYCLTQIRLRTHPDTRFDWTTPELPKASGIIPDGTFTLATSDKATTCYLEVDLGTEGHEVWKGKIDRYLSLARSVQVTAPTADRFRVLIVVPSVRRLESLRTLISKATDKLFWLTTLQQIKSEGLFASIWLRPRSAELLSLL
jgi:hypothetical protein